MKDKLQIYPKFVTQTNKKWRNENISSKDVMYINPFAM